MSKIMPANVVREKNGSWYHPNLPSWDEESFNSAAYKKWLSDNGISVRSIFMQDDPSADSLCDAYFERDEPNFSAWNPVAREGEFLIAIGETEDGPFASFASYVI